MKPELLAPAGDWECVRAAVENGADAIYFGLERFNARMRAANFTVADLPAVMALLHARGVKGYVTFNILIFANELAEAEQFARAIIAAGADGALVQDVGACRLLRRLSPDFPIHASTQMTVTSLAGVKFAGEVGCTRVVLARECSVKEVGRIRAAQLAPDPAGGGAPTVELETFIHGALCVAYSGQCLTSEALGGRSANRGECAQACRLPYELVSDGQTVPLGDRRYLLSPLDLAGLEALPDLIRAGVAAVKIEGRLKSPEYVANITRVYRQALDRTYALLTETSPLTGPAPTPEEAARGLATKMYSESKYDMEMAFSRGLYTGWLGGINNQKLVEGRFGKKRGVYLGRLERVQGERVALRLEGPLKPGDGVVFDAGRPEEKEEGGRVYHLEPHGAETWLSFGRGAVDFRRVQPGDRLWKTSDPELERRWRKSFEGEGPQFQRPLQFEVQGRAGGPMTLLARDECGHSVSVTSRLPISVAEKQPLDEARLRDQLGRLGGTPFRLGRLDNRLEGRVILPVSELNRLRRDAVAQLDALRRLPRRWQLRAPAAADGSPSARLTDVASPLSPAPAEPELIVLVRDWPQFQTALECGVRTLYCEFEDPKRYREAVAAFRAARAEAPAGSTAIFVAPPRIAKVGEEWILEQVRSCQADGYLPRNYDQLEFFAGSRCRGDYSLNVANALSAEYFLDRYGLEGLTASYDLNFEQLQALLESAPPRWFEITIHQHVPMFHMEHCLFCAFLSRGTDYTNCGRPCEKHQVSLRDRTGAEHPLKADAGCRNTVFNARAQTGAEYVGRLLGLGVRRFRVELLNETPAQAAQTIGRYRQLLSGEITGSQVWSELRLVSQLGVTRGQMENRS